MVGGSHMGSTVSVDGIAVDAAALSLQVVYLVG
jgi:hypothetical protein